MLTLFIFVSEELEQPQSIVKAATKEGISATGILLSDLIQVKFRKR